MLEKTRIHRAMLRLDRHDGFRDRGFGVRDLVCETSAVPATVRKTVERAIEDGMLQMRGREKANGPGPREKLYGLTEAGRSVLARESARIYAALVATDEPSDALPNLAADALEAAMERLEALRTSFARRSTLEYRLIVAHAELDEAARDDGEAGLAAVALKSAVASALRRVRDVADDDLEALQAIAREVVARVDDARANRAPQYLDRLVALLPQWRRQAVEQVPSRALAERRVQDVFSHLLADPAAAHAEVPTLTGLGHDLLERCARGELSADQKLTALLDEMKKLQDTLSTRPYRQDDLVPLGAIHDQNHKSDLQPGQIGARPEAASESENLFRFPAERTKGPRGAPPRDGHENVQRMVH